MNAFCQPLELNLQASVDAVHENPIAAYLAAARLKAANRRAFSSELEARHFAVFNP